MIMRILALLFLAVSAMATPMQTNTISFAVPSPSPAKYSDFNMTWVGLSDQYIDMSFNGITVSATDQIYLRLALQRKGSVALEVSGWAIASSNRVIGIVPYTNIPPSGPYYAEVLVKSGTGSPQMVVGFGQIKTESSIFGLSETQKWASTVFISPAYPTNLVLLAANDPTARIWAAGASNLAHAIAPIASNALSRNGGSVTGSLDFTSSGLDSLDYALFDAAPTGAISASRLQWNAARDTLRLGLNSTVNYDLGHQVILYARNADSNTINKGEVVYISGSSGDNATFMRASNDSETRSARTIGIMAETVAQNNFGNIVNQGTIYNLDTSAFPAGAGLYLGAGGTMRTNLPTAPLHGVFLGVVERSHANVGQIYVTIQNYQELRELSDVMLNGQTNLNVLTYIAASNRWEARSVSSMEADPVWGSLSNSIAMNIGLNSTNIVVSSNAAGSASIALSNYFESAMSTASGAVYGTINASSNHLQSSIISVSNHFRTAIGSSTSALYANILAASNHLQSSITAVSNNFRTVIASSTQTINFAINSLSNKLSTDIASVSNMLPLLDVVSNNITLLIANNELLTNALIAERLNITSISNSLVIYTNAAWQGYTNAQAAYAEALSASNLARSGYAVATQALPVAIAGSNLALNANAYATQAHVWAQSGSNLALNANTFATQAHVWALAASNLALSASRASTDLAARASIGQISNWVVATSNALPNLSGISNGISLLDTKIISTSNSLPLLAALSNNIVWATNTAAIAYSIATNAERIAINANSAVIDTNATWQAKVASNLAFSTRVVATQAHAWAITASNLGFNAGTLAETARTWAVAASNQVSTVATNLHYASNSLASAIAGRLALTGGTMQAHLDMNGYSISNIANSSLHFLDGTVLSAASVVNFGYSYKTFDATVAYTTNDLIKYGQDFYVLTNTAGYTFGNYPDAYPGLFERISRDRGTTNIFDQDLNSSQNVVFQQVEASDLFAGDAEGDYIGLNYGGVYSSWGNSISFEEQMIYGAWTFDTVPVITGYTTLAQAEIIAGQVATNVTSAITAGLSVETTNMIKVEGTNVVVDISARQSVYVLSDDTEFDFVIPTNKTSSYELDLYVWATNYTVTWAASVDPNSVTGLVQDSDRPMLLKFIRAPFATNWHCFQQNVFRNPIYPDLASGGGGLSNGLVAYVSFDGVVSNTAGSIRCLETGDDQNLDPFAYGTAFLGSDSGDFNNPNAYAAFEDPILTNGPFSLSLWFYKQSGSSDTYLFGNSTNNISGEVTLGLFGGGTAPTMQIQNQQVWSSTQSVTNGAWYHLVVTHDGSSNAKFYIDGVDVSNHDADTASISADNAVLQAIGFARIPGTTSFAQFSGLIDEFAFWSRQISGAEVTELYNGGAGLAQENF